MTPHILIAIPLSSDGRPHPRTLESVARLMRMGAPWDEIKCRRFGPTHVARERIGEYALREWFTDVLWVDSDIAFEPEDAIRLIEHEVDLVSGVYVTAEPEPIPSARALQDGRHVPVLGQGMQRILYSGLGFTLMSAEVLRRIPSPWFEHIYEDYKLGEQVERHGFTWWGDFDVRVRHQGDREYTVEDAERVMWRAPLPGVLPVGTEWIGGARDTVPRFA